MAASSAVRTRAFAPRLTANQTRLLLRAAALGTAALALKSFVVDPLTGHYGGSTDDFTGYLHAVGAVASGGDPYAWFSAATPVSAGFAYPPFAALLMRPLASLSPNTALSLWLVLNLAATIAGAVIVARLTLPRSWPRIELALLAALAFAPVTYNYWHGQINGLIFFLLAVAMWAYLRERQVTAGLVLGLAAGIKVAPVVLLVLLLRRRWWRGSSAMVACTAATGLLGLAVLGLGPTQKFLTVVLPALGRPTGWIVNQSLTGSLSRVVVQSVLRMQPAPAWLDLACLAAGVGVLVAAVWAVRTAPRSAAERGAEYGLAVTAMLLAGSLTEFAHFTALVIPIFATLGLAAARGGRDARRLFAGAAGAVVVFGVVAPELIALLATPGAVSLGALSHSPWWWLFLQVCSLPCIAACWFALRLRGGLAHSPDPARSGNPLGK